MTPPTPERDSEMQATSEDVERVARAICRVEGCAESFDECDYCQARLGRAGDDSCYAAATAAIEAMQPMLTRLTALSAERAALDMREAAAKYFDARAAVLRLRVSKRATQDWHSDDSDLGQAESDAAAIRALPPTPPDQSAERGETK